MTDDLGTIRRTIRYISDDRKVAQYLGANERDVARERKAASEPRHRGVTLRPDDPGKATDPMSDAAVRHATRMLGERIDALIAAGGRM